MKKKKHIFDIGGSLGALFNAFSTKDIDNFVNQNENYLQNAINNSKVLDLETSDDVLDMYNNRQMYSYDYKKSMRDMLDNNNAEKAVLNGLSTGASIGKNFGGMGALIGGAIGTAVGTASGLLGNVVRGNAVNSATSKLNNLTNTAQLVQGSTMNLATENVMNKNYMNKMANFGNNTVAYGGKLYPFGGALAGYGGDWTTGLNFINNGGTHEENPYEGVPVSIAQDGQPNLVEEGEIVWNDYVFSNRLEVPKEVMEQLKLGKGKKTFAEVVEKVQKEASERPNDPIAKRGLEDSLQKLAAVQEQVRAEQEQQDAYNQAEDTAAMYADGGPIHISKNKRGTFTAAATKHGMGVQEFANHVLSNKDKYSTNMVRKAVFAHNANSWKHGLGGYLVDPYIQYALGGHIAANGMLFNPTNPPVKYTASTPLGYTIAPAESQFRLGVTSPENFPESYWQDLADSNYQEYLNAQYPFRNTFTPLSTGTPFTQEDYQRAAANRNAASGIGVPTKTPITSTKIITPKTKTNTEKQTQKSVLDNTSEALEYYPETIQAFSTDFDPDNIGNFNLDAIYSKPNTNGSYRKEMRKAKKLDKEAEKENGKNTKFDESWLRYAPVLGSAIGSIASLFDKPDMEYANAIEKAGREAAGKLKDVKAKPIGDYLAYNPFDRLFYSNQLAAQSSAQRRAIENAANGNIGAAMAGLANAGYNADVALGQLYRQGEEYNLAQRQKVADFNRGTNMFNSQEDLRAQMANAQTAAQRAQLINQAIAQSAALKLGEKNRIQEARSLNLTNFFDNLGNIGWEAVNRNMINSNRALYYYMQANGISNYKGATEDQKDEMAAMLGKSRKETDKLGAQYDRENKNS